MVTFQHAQPFESNREKRPDERHDDCDFVFSPQRRFSLRIGGPAHYENHRVHRAA